MSRYRKFDPRFWKDEKIRKFDVADKAIAAYLFTAQSNRIGLFNFSPGQAAEDLGMLPQTFREGFQRVSQALDYTFDEEARVLFIPTWWKYNQPENINVLKGCLKDLDDIPETPLISRFCETFRYLDETMHQTFKEGYPKRYPKPSPIQEQEQEQEQEKENGSADDGATPPLLSLKIESRHQDSIDVDHVVQAWNALPHSFSRVSKVSDKRKAAIKRAVREHGIDDVVRAIAKVGQSSHLAGENKDHWKADFDWLFREDYLLKVLEGGWSRQSHSNGNGSNTLPSAEETLKVLAS
jgi:hypothetical protein